jgi:hypothetical protein
MKCFHELTCDWSLGDIYQQAAEALEIAKSTGRTVKFQFNGHTIVVKPEHTVDMVLRQYENRLKGY